MEALFEKINQLSLGQRILALVGSVALLVILCFLFIIRPINNDIEDLNRSYIKIKKDLNEKQRLLENYDQYYAEAEHLKEKLDIALKLLPNVSDLDSLLKKMSELAGHSGAEITRIEPMPEIKKSFYAELPIKMQIEGNYHEVASFFDKVSKLQRIVNITQLLLGSPKWSQNKVVLNVRCLATTFRFLDKSELDAQNAMNKEKRVKKKQRNE